MKPSNQVEHDRPEKKLARVSLPGATAVGVRVGSTIGCLTLAWCCHAQDIDPRRWSHLPTYEN